ncbi:MAG: HsdR family type I site-specific deoxyribonuclease [Kiritimatiellae bacterium]|nr:HsdR family type I site-specific deoxyribonuclease [Kiritimatiellia bacterium]
MPTGAYNENSYENAVMEVLRSMKWECLYGPEVERDYSDPMLADVFVSQVRRLNRDVPAAAVEDAIKQVRGIGGGSLVARNAIFTDWLQNGVEGACTVAGAQTTRLVKLVEYDPKKWKQNTFHAVNQWTVTDGEIERRPDVVLFVNGMPLVVIELKNPSKPETTVHEAYLQLRNYQQDIPELFVFNQICVASDMVSTRAGSLTANESWFKEWKSIDGKKEDGAVGNFETLFHGLLAPERLLDVVKNFVCFSGKGPSSVPGHSWSGFNKILAGYHQYFAVKRAIRKTKEAMGKDGRGGVFWHTQGSGKSLSMVFYAHLLASELDGPTVLVLTDRNDLDGQLYGQFLKCEAFLRQTAVQATSRAHLKEFLKNQRQNGIFFSTIQKFEEADDALSRRRDLIVIADEAHRGHYGFAETEKTVRQKDGTITTRRSVPTARIIHDSLPNATFIGFTGTPIDEGDRSTREVFGDYIDIYDMTQAVEDGATRPVYYESRVVRLKLDNEALAAIDAEYKRIAAEDEADDVVVEQSKRDMSQMEVLLGHDDTVNSLVDDILDHYEHYREDNLAGKAMIVAYSRPIAVKIYKRFLKLRPEWGKTGKIQVVMTEGNQDPEEWRKIVGTKRDRFERAEKFKDVDSPFKIAIVVDMWLTGFDVPCLDTMYVYKPMSGHNLMQAIARVNRVYKDKEGGLVVDYIGIASELKRAMHEYTVRDRKKYGNPDVSKIAKPKFYEHLEVCRAQLHGYDYGKGIDGTDLERAKAINGAVNFLLATKKKREKDIFLENAYLMKQALSLCAALIPESDRFEAGFMEAVRGMINQWTMTGSGGEKKGLAELNAHIADMVRESVSSEGVINLFSDKKAAVSLFDAAFLTEIRRMKEKNIAVEILKKLLTESIQLHARRNLVKSEEFSQLLSNAMNEYVNGHITNEEVIKRLIELANRIKAGIDSTPKGLTEDEAAFYDALAKPEAVRKFYTDDTLIQLTKELTDQLRRNRTVDWDKRESARAHMRMLVKRLLKKYKYPPDEAADALKTVMRQCELWVDTTEFEEIDTHDRHDAGTILADVGEALKFREYLPLYSLRAACGVLGDGEIIEPEGWVKAEGIGRLDKTMVVVHAEGDSMEPTIHDGDLCVVRKIGGGNYDDQIVLVQRNDKASDPELGGAYLLKKLVKKGGKTLFRSINREYPDISIDHDDDITIVASLHKVLHR